jgi:hypothetical protein
MGFPPLLQEFRVTFTGKRPGLPRKPKGCSFLSLDLMVVDWSICGECGTYRKICSLLFALDWLSENSISEEALPGKY